MKIGNLDLQINTGIIVLWVLIVISLASLIFRDGGVLDYRELTFKEEEILDDIELMEKKKNKLSEQLEYIKTNPHYLENVAREKIGLIKKNEIVYEIRNQ